MPLGAIQVGPKVLHGLFFWFLLGPVWLPASFAPVYSCWKYVKPGFSAIVGWSSWFHMICKPLTSWLVPKRQHNCCAHWDTSLVSSRGGMGRVVGIAKKPSIGGGTPQAKFWFLQWITDEICCVRMELLCQIQPAFPVVGRGGKRSPRRLRWGSEDLHGQKPGWTQIVIRKSTEQQDWLEKLHCLVYLTPCLLSFIPAISSHSSQFRVPLTRLPYFLCCEIIHGALKDRLWACPSKLSTSQSPLDCHGSVTTRNICVKWTLCQFSTSRLACCMNLCHQKLGASELRPGN